MLVIRELTYRDDHPGPVQWSYQLDATGPLTGPFPLGKAAPVGVPASEILVRVQDGSGTETHQVLLAAPLQGSAHELFVHYRLPATPVTGSLGSPGPGTGIPVSGFTYADDTRNAQNYRMRIDTGGWSSPRPLGSRSSVNRPNVDVVSSHTMSLDGNDRFSHARFTSAPGGGVDVEVHTHP